MFHPVTVEVSRPVSVGKDRFGNDVVERSVSEVRGVLPQPGSTDNLDAARPDGVRVDVTFHFPRGYGKGLKGCSVIWSGEEYRVIGDPQPYNEPDTPGPFSLTVETERVDG